MRNLIIEQLVEEMRKDPTIFFITADMGINLVEKISTEFPDRFLNVGIAEQNAIGVAAGLASSGYVPWVYSISNFLIHRCFEQIRNDLVLHDFRAVLLGTSAGYDNAPLGPTHHVIDDWGMIAGLPGTSVFTPATIEYAGGLIRRMQEVEGVSYLRISKDGTSILDSDAAGLLSGTGSSGRLVISYGGVGSRLFSSGAVSPEDWFLLLNQVWPLPPILHEALDKKPDKIVVVEDHFRETGLSNRIAGVMADNLEASKFVSRSPDRFDFEVRASVADWENHIGLHIRDLT
jgi:transketolase C-terminal domain/subunit